MKINVSTVKKAINPIIFGFIIFEICIFIIYLTSILLTGKPYHLGRVGNDVSLSNREDVIKSLQLTQRELIRALQTERILRENPNFNQKKFNVDISAIEALKVIQTANEYGRILDDALQLAVSVKQEMDILQKFS